MPAQHPYQLRDQLSIMPGLSPDLDGVVGSRMAFTLDEVAAAVVARFGDDSPEAKSIPVAIAAFDAADWVTISGTSPQAYRSHRVPVELRKAMVSKYGKATPAVAAFDAIAAAERDPKALAAVCFERFGVEPQSR